MTLERNLDVWRRDLALKSIQPKAPTIQQDTFFIHLCVCVLLWIWFGFYCLCQADKTFLDAGTQFAVYAKVLAQHRTCCAIASHKHIFLLSRTNSEWEGRSVPDWQHHPTDACVCASYTNENVVRPIGITYQLNVVRESWCAVYCQHHVRQDRRVKAMFDLKKREIRWNDKRPGGLLAWKRMWMSTFYIIFNVFYIRYFFKVSTK